MKTMALLFATVLLATPLLAENAENGRSLSIENCARCHDISPGGVAKQDPPSFAAIAWYRTDAQIEARILNPAFHSGMPAWDVWLRNADVLDIVAYIRTLEDS